MTRAVEESVLTKVGVRASEVHVAKMTVLARVVTQVEETMALVNVERVEDANVSVMGDGLQRQREGGWR